MTNAIVKPCFISTDWPLQRIWLDGFVSALNRFSVICNGKKASEARTAIITICLSLFNGDTDWSHTVSLTWPTPYHVMLVTMMPFLILTYFWLLSGQISRARFCLSWLAFINHLPVSWLSFNNVLVLNEEHPPTTIKVYSGFHLPSSERQNGNSRIRKFFFLVVRISSASSVKWQWWLWR